MELRKGPAGMPWIPVVSHWHNGLSRGGAATMTFQGKRADTSSWLKTREEGGPRSDITSILGIFGAI